MLLFYPRKVISGKEKAKKVGKIKKNVAFYPRKTVPGREKAKKRQDKSKKCCYEGSCIMYNIVIKSDEGRFRLRGYVFDIIIDVNAYTKRAIELLIDAVDNIKDYVLISSSAVYPETNIQPFAENQLVGRNSIWGDYGTNKIEAEKYLMDKVPNAYIIRPPYLCGAMNNVYREAFVFPQV